jgi:hypothetical protein
MTSTPEIEHVLITGLVPLYLTVEPPARAETFPGVPGQDHQWPASGNHQPGQ